MYRWLDIEPPTKEAWRVTAKDMIWKQWHIDICHKYWSKRLQHMNKT